MQSHPSKAGNVKVWYTLEGKNAIPSEDTAPKNGVPDYAETVAAKLEETWQALIERDGFRPPLDDAQYHDRPDYGGDGRFDVYLQDIKSNDGYRVTEACKTDRPQCAGYLVMENDFKGFGYPSQTRAIKVLASHEFMHAIQGAYLASIPRFWSEGTATWAEERVFPEQRDYERFLSVFFRSIDRPLDHEQSGNLGDSFPYGTAVWPTFLAQRFDPAVITDIFEALANKGAELSDPGDIDFWKLTDMVLEQRGSNLEEAFTEFGLWNLLTGDRRSAGSDQLGYEGADTWWQAKVAPLEWTGGPADGPLANVEADLRHLTAEYSSFDLLPHAGETVELKAYGRLRFAVLAVGGEGDAEPTYLAPAGAFDRATIELPASGTLYVAAVNVDTETRTLQGSLKMHSTQSDQPDAGMMTDVGTPDAGAMVDSGGPDAGRVDTGADSNPSGEHAGSQTDGGCSQSGSREPVAPLALVLVGVAAGLRVRRTARRRV